MRTPKVLRHRRPRHDEIVRPPLRSREVRINPNSQKRLVAILRLDPTLRSIREVWWTLPGSNRGPLVCDTSALTN